jgi:phenylacetyl-CoA:acceptor oxidoreductase
MIDMPGKPAHNERTVSTYCYQCVAGPDLLKVRVEDDVATEVTPNFDAATIHPGGGGHALSVAGRSITRIDPSGETDEPEEGRDEDPLIRISWEDAIACRRQA